MYGKLSIDQVLINKLNEVLEVNLENELFGVKEFTEELGISRTQLHRKINKITGKSTSQFIREFRLEKAMEMLQGNVATASEIAYRVGFNSPTYFNTCFRDYYGYPPGEVKFRNPKVIEKSDAEQTKHLANHDQDNAVTSSIEKISSRQRMMLLFSLGLLLIIAFSYYYYFNSKDIIKPEAKETVINEKSIAIIPFKNLSENKEDEYFTKGVMESVQNQLSNIKDLKVISGKSMQRFADTSMAASEIARDIGASHLLDGTCLKFGDSIRIIIHLIDAKDDHQLSSLVFDEAFKHLFAVQTDIAKQVAEDLNITLSPIEIEDIEKNPTDNLEAYDSYLKGSYILSNPSIDNIIASRKYFEKAIELDSLFVEAYLGLSRSYKLMGVWNGNMSYEEAEQLAFPYLEKTLQLSPSNPRVLNELAWTKLLGWNFTFADSLFQELRSQDQKVVDDYQPNLMFGRYDKVIEICNSELKRDPISSYGRIPLAYAYYYKGKIDSTLYIIEESLQMQPYNVAFYDHFGNIFIALEEYLKAKNLLEKGLEISDKPHASMLVHLAIVYHYLDDEETSLQFLNEVIDRANSSEPEINVFLSHYYSHLGNLNEAFKWLDKSFEKHEVDLIWLKAEPNLENIREDKRYDKLYRKIGFHKVE